MTEPTAYVFVDLDGAPRAVGRLFVHSARQRETASFQYDPAWRDDPRAFALEPALTLSAAPHHAPAGRALFGALSDSMPDRWGQTLMRRAERQRSADDERVPRALRPIDFLLGVTDTVRQGAVRFARGPEGPFLAPETPGGVPLLVELPRLLAAAERYLSEDTVATEDLQLLLAPGSSLGGARPKASVRARDGTLLIAKFGRPDDEYRVVAWEAVALQLAEYAGIRVTARRLERIAGRDVLLVERFDRTGARRIPYLSAMSLLGAGEGESRSYVEIAEALRAHGAEARADLAELWRRLVFSIAIANTDDHLRNHGVLHVGTAGWVLAPAFDLNPVPADLRPRVLTTAITEDGESHASLDVARSVADRFGLSGTSAAAIAGEVTRAVARWRAVASTFGLARAEIERLATAFGPPPPRLH